MPSSISLLCLLGLLGANYVPLTEGFTPGGLGASLAHKSVGRSFLPAAGVGGASPATLGSSSSSKRGASRSVASPFALRAIADDDVIARELAAAVARTIGPAAGAAGASSSAVATAERPAADDEAEEGPDKPRRGTVKYITREVEQWVKKVDLPVDRIHVCRHRYLPVVISDYWKVLSEMIDEREEAGAGAGSGEEGEEGEQEFRKEDDPRGRLLFVVPGCELFNENFYLLWRTENAFKQAGEVSKKGFKKYDFDLEVYHPGTYDPGDNFFGPDIETRERVETMVRRHHNNEAVAATPYPMLGITAASKPTQESNELEEDRYDTIDAGAFAPPPGEVTIPEDYLQIDREQQSWVDYIKGQASWDKARFVKNFESMGFVDVSRGKTKEHVMADVWMAYANLEKRVLLAHEDQSSFDKGDLALLRGVNRGLVIPHFTNVDIETVRRFARDVVISFAQSPVLYDIDVEVFHPKYVDNIGAIDQRRSPYAMLQLVYRGKKEELFTRFKEEDMFRGQFEDDLEAEERKLVGMRLELEKEGPPVCKDPSKSKMWQDTMKAKKRFGVGKSWV